jgi:hypothetical protein
MDISDDELSGTPTSEEEGVEIYSPDEQSQIAEEDITAIQQTETAVDAMQLEIANVIDGM